MTDERFRTVLTSRGRRTGSEYRTELLAVMLEGDVYLTRHRPDSDWFRNCLANPRVTVTVGGKEVSGTAEQVADESTVRRVCELKYPGDPRARERRVAIRVRPDER